LERETRAERHLATKSRIDFAGRRHQVSSEIVIRSTAWQAQPDFLLKLGQHVHHVVMTDIPKHLNDQLVKLGLAPLFSTPPSR
jgi:hypothetical protein